MKPTNLSNDNNLLSDINMVDFDTNNSSNLQIDKEKFRLFCNELNTIVEKLNEVSNNLEEHDNYIKQVTKNYYKRFEAGVAKAGMFTSILNSGEPNNIYELSRIIKSLDKLYENMEGIFADINSFEEGDVIVPDTNSNENGTITPSEPPSNQMPSGSSGTESSVADMSIPLVSIKEELMKAKDEGYDMAQVTWGENKSIWLQLTDDNINAFLNTISGEDVVIGTSVSILAQSVTNTGEKEISIQIEGHDDSSNSDIGVNNPSMNGSEGNGNQVPSTHRNETPSKGDIRITPVPENPSSETPSNSGIGANNSPSDNHINDFEGNGNQGSSTPRNETPPIQEPTEVLEPEVEPIPENPASETPPVQEPSEILEPEVEPILENPASETPPVQEPSEILEPEVEPILDNPGSKATIPPIEDKPSDGREPNVTFINVGPEEINVTRKVQYNNNYGYAPNTTPDYTYQYNPGGTSYVKPEVQPAYKEPVYSFETMEPAMENPDLYRTSRTNSNSNYGTTVSNPSIQPVDVTPLSDITSNNSAQAMSANEFGNNTSIGISGIGLGAAAAAYGIKRDVKSKDEEDKDAYKGGNDER